MRRKFGVEGDVGTDGLVNDMANSTDALMFAEQERGAQSTCFESLFGGRGYT